MCLLSQNLLTHFGTVCFVEGDDFERGRKFVKAYLLEIKRRGLNKNLNHLETYFKEDGISQDAARFVQSACMTEVEKLCGSSSFNALESCETKQRVLAALCIKAAVDFYVYGTKGSLNLMISYGVLDNVTAKALAETFLLT